MPDLDAATSTRIVMLREALGVAATDPDPALRLVRIVAVLSKALGIVGISPVLVGGGAVQFYSAADYVTEDIDLLAPSLPEVLEVMSLLGFDRVGKDFRHPGFEIFVEFPGSRLEPPEEFVSLFVDDVEVRIVSLEDLLMDRLRAFVHWRSLRDGLNVLSLLRSKSPVDPERMTRLLSSEGFSRVWRRLENLAKSAVSGESESLEKELREMLDEPTD